MSLHLHVHHLWGSVGPLVGVLVGSGITVGFQFWQRNSERADQRLDRTTEAVLGVIESGTEALLRSDLFTLVLIKSPDLVTVVDSEPFRVYNQACAQYLAAVARARCLVGGDVEQALVLAQDAIGEMSGAAKDAGAAIGKPEQQERLAAYSAALDHARDTQNQFAVAAIDFLHAASTK